MTIDYLSLGIAAAKAGKVEEARKLLDKAIRAAPDDERTWGWFYSVCLNDTERIKCLKEILRINPNHDQAKQRYNELMGAQVKPIAPIAPQLKKTAKMKKCPYCAEEIQDDAMVCRFCGRELNPHKPVVSQTSMPKKKNSHTLLYVLLIAVFLIIILCVVGGLFSGSISNNNNEKSTLTSEALAYEAKDSCEQFIKNRILTPSTAKFSAETTYTIQGQADAFRLTGDVDAQNGFGAMIRNYFSCDVQRVGTESNGNDRWHLLNLDLNP